MDRLRRIAALALYAAVFTAAMGAVAFAAEDSGDDSMEFLPDTSFAFPVGADIHARWLIPPMPKGRQNAHFDITSRGTPLIGYGENEKNLIYPDKGYIAKVDTGYSDFTCLDNGLTLFANGNDIAILAQPKGDSQTSKGIPILGLQPVTSVPVRECTLFGSFGNTAYCAGLNEKSGNRELYLLGQKKGTGIQELEKFLAASTTITAITGDDQYIFVAYGRRVLRIDRTTKEAASVFTHPSVIIKGLAYSAQSGLFMSTGRSVFFSGRHGTMEIMRSPAHQIAMRQGVLYVFLPQSYALFAVENLEDLNRYNLNTRPVPEEKKNIATVESVRFFEAGPPPYTTRPYSDHFDRKLVRSIVAQIDYRNTSAQEKHSAVVVWYEPTGGQLSRKTYSISAPSGSLLAAIGGETGGKGYTKQKWVFGDDSLGLKYPGRYRITVSIDGADTSEHFFVLDGQPTPFEAIAYDDTDMMKRLIAQGTSPNQKDENGIPLLHEAVQYGTPRMVELLLKAGADANATDSRNTPALDIAIHRAPDWRKKADLLFENGARPDTKFGERGVPLTHSMALTEPQLYYLIQKGASVHGEDPATKVPVLGRATYRDYYCTDRLFDLLIKRGARLETVDDEGLTPMGTAVKYAHPECVAQLLKRGAAIEGVWTDRNGKGSALFLALSGYADDEKDNYSAGLAKRIRIIEMLREKGAVLGPREGWIVTEGSAASFFTSEEVFRYIGVDDYTLEKASKSQHPVVRQLAARHYLEKTREDAQTAGNSAELNNALASCNVARGLYEADLMAQKAPLPEIYLYCGILEHQIGNMDKAADADLQKYLDLVPTTPNAKQLRSLIKNPAK